ncbi:endothelin-converting enzyme/putative endopeptidase [Singulisphaera sp. GP187]|uniref:M13 family metallopeptidase n=1 Tax=Singulisphaera sp. GP187 TaxID=1882752 RepID=UPI00092BD813|nr:M13 family metallopeptidase [Singulisphaera sp. GP187]SIN70146.1 endothelin-converting enzyme/putative endopeptidase [Singulisphaera sp. GP187]
MKASLLGCACVMLMASQVERPSSAQDSAPDPSGRPATEAVTVHKPAFGNWGVAIQHLSRSVRPGDDFFTYVNEGWIKSTKVPPDSWDFGGFDELIRKNEPRIHSLIREARKAAAPPGDPRQQIGDLYAAFLDTARIEELGLSPIQAELNRILAIRTHEEAGRWMADPRSSSLVMINVYPDAGHTTRWLLHLDQVNPGQDLLGLPRDFYERMDGPIPGHRAAYVAYVAETLQRAGIDNPARRASDILALETKLAARQWNLEQLRDRKANYHLMTRGELAAYAPAFPWDAFLAARQVGDVKEVVLGTDTAVKAQAEIFGATPVDVWSSYLAFHWIRNQVDLLPSAFQTASFDFYERRLRGAKDQRPRELRALQFVNSSLGELVGKLYVERYFPQESLARASELFDYLRRAFAERLAEVDWMDDKTRAEAQAKLAAFRFKIGYPKVWRDYSTISIKRDDLVGSARRIREADWSRQRSRLSQRDRNLDSSWYQTPQTIDASFSVLLNAIELPAALLQPSFFDPYADPAVNFGSIGAIIGHEMGHGFDDQGALFDGQGRMRNWWTDYSSKHFKDRTAALVGQYSAFAPIEGLHLNGKQTLGENISDLTGVSIAYRAYRLYLRDHHGGSAPVLDGLSGDQRFFLSWGQTWRYIAPEDAIRYIIKTGYRPPAKYRVNSVVRNIDAWYDAFGVTLDQGLYLPPEARVRLW